MSEASRRADLSDEAWCSERAKQGRLAKSEPGHTIHHGSDYADQRRGDTLSDEGYVGQVGAFNGVIKQLSEDHRALRDTSLAIREPRPTKDGPLPS
jgi:hypothetical protein